MRYRLANDELSLDDGRTVTTRTVPEEELLDLLSGTFGLDFPAGTRFRPPFAE